MKIKAHPLFSGYYCIEDETHVIAGAERWLKHREELKNRIWAHSKFHKQEAKQFLKELEGENGSS